MLRWYLVDCLPPPLLPSPLLNLSLLSPSPPLPPAPLSFSQTYSPTAHTTCVCLRPLGVGVRAHPAATPQPHLEQVSPPSATLAHDPSPDTALPSCLPSLPLSVPDAVVDLLSLLPPCPVRGTLAVEWSSPDELELNGPVEEVTFELSYKPTTSVEPPERATTGGFVTVSVCVCVCVCVCACGAT